MLRAINSQRRNEVIGNLLSELFNLDVWHSGNGLLLWKHVFVVLVAMITFTQAEVSSISNHISIKHGGHKTCELTATYYKMNWTLHALQNNISQKRKRPG